MNPQYEEFNSSNEAKENLEEETTKQNQAPNTQHSQQNQKPFTFQVKMTPANYFKSYVKKYVPNKTTKVQKANEEENQEQEENNEGNYDNENIEGNEANVENVGDVENENEGNNEHEVALNEVDYVDNVEYMSQDYQKNTRSNFIFFDSNSGYTTEDITETIVGKV